MKFLFSLFVFVLPCYSFALGKVISYEEMRRSHFNSIQKLSTCGNWHYNNRVGEFRLIETFYAGQDMLFVDIVEMNKNQSRLSVVKGFSFPQINNDHSGLSLNDITCTQSKRNQIKLVFTTTSAHDYVAKQVVIFIDAEKQTFSYQDAVL